MIFSLLLVVLLAGIAIWLVSTLAAIRRNMQRTVELLEERRSGVARRTP